MARHSEPGASSRRTSSGGEGTHPSQELTSGPATPGRGYIDQVLIQVPNSSARRERDGTRWTSGPTEPQVSRHAGTRRHRWKGTLNPQVLGSSPRGYNTKALVSVAGQGLPRCRRTSRPPRSMDVSRARYTPGRVSTDELAPSSLGPAPGVQGSFRSPAPVSRYPGAVVAGSACTRSTRADPAISGVNGSPN
jgi:hypothetical protein